MYGLGKPRSKFGKWLDNRGIKQQWVAEKSGVSRGTISDLAVYDDRSPTFKNARAILNVLREIDKTVDYDDFWT